MFLHSEEHSEADRMKTGSGSQGIVDNSRDATAWSRFNIPFLE